MVRFLIGLYERERMCWSQVLPYAGYLISGVIFFYSKISDRGEEATR
jgi:hypothetical protein